MKSARGRLYGVKRLLSAPRRAARRKGFGIHSPFAFDFVRRVIAQPCAYYAYSTIDREAKTTHGSRSRSRLLFRVSLYFRPKRIAISGNIDDSAKKALISGCSSAELKANCDADLWIINSEAMMPREELNRCIENGGTAVFTHLKGNRDRREKVTGIWHDHAHGMLFMGSDTAILVGLKHLPHQRFDVWI